VVINDEDEAAAVRHRLLPRDRIHSMPGIGVDREQYDPAVVSEAEIARVRGELGLAATAPLFLMVGEFNPGKRHVDALQALAKMARKDAHLAFAGSGPQLGRVRQLAGALGVEERVHFLGFRRDIPALVRASAAVLLPSVREGLPRCVMEALCLEVPVIGTNIRGTRELLQGGAGLLVEIGDVSALSGAMAWVVEHADEARSMGRLGRAQMAARDLQRILALHEALYAEALGGGWQAGGVRPEAREQVGSRHEA
jgi:glycosyltransferase involved in cell wall biosynthesis